MGRRDRFSFFKRKKDAKTVEDDQNRQDESSPIPDEKTPRQIIHSSREDLSVQGKPNSREEQSLVANEMWNEAYEKLKTDESTMSLVVEYEEALRSQLLALGWESKGHDAAMASELASLDGHVRHALIARMASTRLDDISKFLSNQKMVSKIASAIDTIKGTVGHALEACPSACIAWAAVCLFVIPVIGNNAQQISDNQEGLRYVTSKLPWYTQLIDLLNSDAWKSPAEFNGLRGKIREQIVYLYRLLIEFQLRSFQCFRHPLSTIAKNIVKWDNWNHMLAEIKEAERTLDLYMGTYHKSNVQHKFNELVKETTKTRDVLNTTLQEQLKVSEDILDANNKLVDFVDTRRVAELINKFKPDPSHLSLDMYEDSYGLIASPHDDTGRGVFNHSAFKQWINSDRGLLVLAAHPGTGKSVLAKHMAELLKTESTVVCSFFFKENRSYQDRPSVAICKIFYDFLKQYPRLDLLEEKLHRLDRQDIRHDSNAFWDILNAASQENTDANLTIILDALDECDRGRRGALLKRLNSFHSEFPEAKVRFLVTTRPLHDILSCLNDGCILNLDDDDVCRQSLSNDIANVARNQFEKFVQAKGIEDDDTKQVLSDSLRMKEDRTYLYVKLLFEFLDTQPLQFDPSDWVHIFEELPRNVSDTYCAFLERVQGKRNQDVIKVMLEIILAATRPLTLAEMKIALYLCLNGHNNGLKLQSDNAFKSYILGACGFFLNVFKGRIYFIHQTVKDYLLHVDDTARPSWLGGFCMKTCHKTLAESCIAYLSLPSLETESFMSIEEYAQANSISRVKYHRWFKDSFEFGDYAFSQWIIHLTGSQDDPQSLDGLLHQYPGLDMNRTVAIFCCSSLPSHVETQTFLGALPEEIPQIDDILSCLSLSLVAKFHENRAISDLNYGVSLAERVKQRTADDHPKRPKRLSDLSWGLLLQFFFTEKLEALESSLAVTEEAVRITPTDHVDRGLVLNAHAASLFRLYISNGKVEILDQAIADAQGAIEALGRTTKKFPEKGECFNTLPLCLEHRYFLTEDIEDLNKAIDAGQHTISSTPENHPSLGVSLTRLSMAFGWRYKRPDRTDTERVDDINQAIKFAKDAVKASENDNINRCIHLNHLAFLFHDRYQVEKEKEDIIQAVAIGGQAVEAALSDHPERARLLSNLEFFREQKQKELDGNL